MNIYTNTMGNSYVLVYIIYLYNMQPWCVMFNGYADGCNCCENDKIDLFNSKSNYAEICEGEGNIQVPCSCRNDENKVSTCSCTPISDSSCVHYHTCMSYKHYHMLVHICHTSHMSSNSQHIMASVV